MILVHRPRRALGSVLAVVLGAIALAPVSSSAQDPTPTSSDQGPALAPADPLLDEARRGRRAIRELGDRLAVAAARNDMGPARLRTLLRTDETAWVDPEGQVYFVEPLPEQAPASDGGAASAAAPLTETFALHSNPGADRTILLDFDGAVVSGTAWNESDGVSTGPHPAWDPARDGAGFTDSELVKVQEVWAMVAEDFAPFDVDVTTEDPGDAGLVRSSLADFTYGTRVLITPSADASGKLCGGGCGGIAYLDVFGEVGADHQPAWVFPQSLGQDPKSVAEAASHEAGHNLGLQHDGTSKQDYYRGHGLWAPIMGVGYDRPLAQWSRGSYADANNREDDLSILTGHLPARPDEAADAVRTPSPLPAGEAVIGTPGDVDAYLLGSCTAGTAVSVLPAGLAPDLDVRAVLHDSSGAQRVVAAPPSAYVDRRQASGLDAQLTVPADGDGWVLTVEGVGDGAWASSGYDDYGSLGAYSVSAPGCGAGVAGLVPQAPGAASATPAGTSALSLAWSAPAAAGGGPVTGYVVSRSGAAGSTTLSAEARSHTFTGLAAGTEYHLSVRAVNAAGAGPSATVTARTDAPPAAAPSAPYGVSGLHDPAADELEAWWSEPLDAGSHPVTAYEISLDGDVLGSLGATSRGVEITSEDGFPDGRYVVGVAAVNAAGSSPVATVTITVDRPDAPPPSSPTPTPGATPVPTPPPTTQPTSGPSAPPAAAPDRMKAPRAKSGRAKVVVRWVAAPANGSAVTRYVVDISKGKDATVAGSARRWVFKHLRPGRYRFRVTAVNAVGASRPSAWVKVRVR